MSTWPSDRTTHLLETLLALATLVSTDLSLDYNPWYPEWIHTGPLTLPPSAIAPMILSIAILLFRGRSTNPRGIGRRALTAFAAITLILCLYAIWNLNTAPGGVYWAGFFPLITGVLLAVSTLLRLIIERIRQ
ncbi:hypothetical protein [Haladaptatus sp. AB643]|uniref:hypothetical protein n=1 Tax=Haladaptatus sp. AB643 TaxID=2934174 RepID=UPI00209C5447|nr:hypothetical protein [Haladaptatus sp. AB643]MCO8246573.1 hypothetical protein [Haladaptatus sp. AB643]